ncbi:TPA: hypothetical protein L5597_004142 [Pseudomonas aeruginosa]|uniref:hypothetical protein n=1 Tax=Pseudomonas aeruginosa TaxID=287 RepID=UPI000B48ED39|nr:hypothetical protein [Pseudomonas aeruginosa]MCS8361532.1 hypothetical protein [Pseudomonas aeruginosa]MCS8644868.1 hypothetical protein [Pseudomonas aeruginosa]OWI29605.1 hypothetical protein CDC11_00465 [Pseudomonas aeruginosa]HBP4696641.1 hypothetical protein [Pseudomonas aeruginosa]HCE6793257.1 hypothetical protein [Pseudomonas aeruginosa]
MSNEDWNELDESYRSALSGALETAHPAVEQAGGDERAAFEAYRDRRNALLESEGHNPGSKWHVTNAHYPTWEASRAALAQPSPAQAEQAEPERPEVVAWQYRVTAGPQTGWSLWHPGKGEEFERSYTVERRPLMTVAQHERIVKAWIERWKAYIELSAKIAAQRDAALARVAELEHSQSFQRDIDYSVLSEYADKHRLHFNNLCAVVRSALIALPAQAQHSVPETTNEEANSFLRVADAGQFKDNAAAVRTAAMIIRGLLHRPAIMKSIIRHRIGLTPEYEGQWHADLYGEDGEVQHHAEADTPDEAVRAVVALAAAPGKEGNDD